MRAVSDEVLSLSGVSFFRGQRNILSGVNFSVRAGELVAVMGPSGNGKTTILELLSGLLVPAEGVVLIEGRNLSGIDSSELLRIRRRMGVSFQMGALFADLSVFDNVAFPLRELTQLPEDVIHDLVFMKLEAVGLRSFSSFLPSELSGGMLRRVSLARALVLDPSILLCDEPFSGLDPVSTNAAARLIRSMTNIFRAATVVVTHHLDETLSIFDRVCLLMAGAIVFDGPPAQAFQSDRPEVSDFMRGKSLDMPPLHNPEKCLLARDLRIPDPC